ncbi:MAG: hypothetical protein OEU36_14025, partial [Gammaproteobacteria bacterium]|nr:hypothetical protein [Gammaproteobacteria bacterium]
MQAARKPDPYGATEMSEDARSPSANPYNDWLSSVSNDWRKLENTPGLIKDEALCKAALALDGDALQFVPEALKTKELCMLAAEHRTELQFIPNGVLNQELIFAVVKNNPSQIRKVPINMCTASVLAEYVKSGSAYDLYELCEKSGNPMEKVALILVASGLDDLDALPGYAMTPPVYAMAEQLYSGDTVRHQWQATRTRHKPNYLESKLSREMLKQLQTDPESYRRYHVHLF